MESSQCVDLEGMSWHDVHVSKIRIFRQSRSLEMHLDYICSAEVGSQGSLLFCLRPAILSFHDIRSFEDLRDWVAAEKDDCIILENIRKGVLGDGEFGYVVECMSFNIFVSLSRACLLFVGPEVRSQSQSLDI